MNGSGEPFGDSNPWNETRRLSGLVQYAAFSCYSFFKRCRSRWWRAKTGRQHKLCQQLLNPRTEKFPQLWMYRPAQSLQPIRAQPRSPKSRGGNFCEQTSGSVSTCVSFSLLCNVRADGVYPLSPSGSHGSNDLSMLAWSTHCDEERFRAMITLSLRGCPPSSQTSALRGSICNGRKPGNVFRSMRFGSLKGSGFHSGPTLQWGLCGNKGSRKLYHVSFGAYRFDETSFAFPLEWQDCMWLCLHRYLHYLLYRCHPKAEKYL